MTPAGSNPESSDPVPAPALSLAGAPLEAEAPGQAGSAPASLYYTPAEGLDLHFDLDESAQVEEDAAEEVDEGAEPPDEEMPSMIKTGIHICRAIFVLYLFLLSHTSKVKGHHSIPGCRASLISGCKLLQIAADRLLGC